MNPQEKMAWYMLAVLLLTLVTYFVMLTLSGGNPGSGGAFGLLGLLGFAGAFGTGKKNKVAADEHDQLISYKAMLAAFQVFWLYFVGYCMFMIPPIRSGTTVPSYMFTLLLLTGLFVMIGVRSIAILVLYRAATRDEDTLVDRYRRLARVRKAGLGALLISPLVLGPMTYGMNMLTAVDMPESFALLFGGTTCAAFAAVFWGYRRQMGAIARGEGLLHTAARIRRRGDVALLLGLVGAGIGASVIWLLPGGAFTVVKIPQVIFYALCCGILGQGFAAFITNPSEMDQNTAREAGHA